MSLVRSISWNYLGYFCEFIAGVLLVAYVVRRIPVPDYGIFLMAQSIVGFLYILDFGLSNVLVQLYVATWSSKGMAAVGRLASTLFLALLGVGTLGAIVLSALALLVPQLIQLPSAQTALAVRVLIVIAFTVPPAMASMALEHLCQAFHRFDQVNQVQIGLVVLRVGLTVAALATGKGILGLAAVQMAVALTKLLSLWLATRGSIAGFELNLLHFERARVAEAMQSSGWALSDDLARRIAGSSDAAILAGLGSFRQVAMFGMGGKLPAHIFQFAVRGLAVMMPSLSRHYNEGDTAQLRESYRNACRVCVTGMLPPVVFAAICSRQLLEVWAGPAYREAAPALVWLLIFALSQVVEFPSDLVLYSHDRIRQAARFSLIESVAKIALVLALVVLFGAAGVAAAAAITHWCVNLFGYLPEACRVAGLNPRELGREVLSGYGTRQSAIFAGGAAALYVGSRHLPPVAVFVACAAACALYAGVWLAYTARPMWKAAERDSLAAAL